MLLYGAYPRLLLAMLADVARACLTLSRALIVPSVLFLPPLLSALYLAAGLYHHRPLKVGESAILTSHSQRDFELKTPVEVKVDIANFRHPQLNRRLWRLRATQPGDWELNLDGPTTMVVSASPEAAYPWIDPLDDALAHPTRAHLSKIFRAPWWLALLLFFLLWSWLLTLHSRRGNRAA